jgi:predicted membrane GTPase involved in stress response
MQEYTEFMGPMDRVRKGVLVSMSDGEATAYALSDLTARGTMFVKEGDAVYAGMIVGESSTEDDLHVCPSSYACMGYKRPSSHVCMKCTAMLLSLCVCL